MCRSIPPRSTRVRREALILVVLLATERKGRAYPGRTFWLYMLMYGVSRFIIEFYRGDERGLVFGVLSTSQFISTVLVPLSVVMLVWLSRRPQPSPEAGGKAGQARVLTTMSRVELAVTDEYAGERLDRFLAAVLPGHSRSQIQRLIKDGLVQVGPRAVRANASVRDGRHGRRGRARADCCGTCRRGHSARHRL